MQLGLGACRELATFSPHGFHTPAGEIWRVRKAFASNAIISAFPGTAVDIRLSGLGCVHNS